MSERKVWPIERVATVSTTSPPVFAEGYLVDAAGTVYAAPHRFFHGVMLACLYPELALAYLRPPMVRNAKEAPLEFPEDLNEIDCRAFQDFELAHASKLPVIRICRARMLGPTSLDIPGDDISITNAQYQAVVSVLNTLGVGRNDEVSTNLRDMTRTEALKLLMAKIV